MKKTVNPLRVGGSPLHINFHSSAVFLLLRHWLSYGGGGCQEGFSGLPYVQCLSWRTILAGGRVGGYHCGDADEDRGELKLKGGNLASHQR